MSLRKGGRDGTLIVVDQRLERGFAVPEIAPTLQTALENWEQKRLPLESAYSRLNEDPQLGFPLSFGELVSPLPRAYQWLDGSAYLSHVERVRRARGASMPPSFLTEPLMYQGGSDAFLGPCDPICVEQEAWGLDFEAEVAVVTDDVVQGVSPEQAAEHIKLVMLVNDVSLRNLIPAELKKGFGFLHGKPASAFSPVAVTPDELGDTWRKGKVHLPLRSYLSGEQMGEPDAGRDMQFDFPTLISHAAKTRPLGAGTIIGSGTVSNVDQSRGVSCLMERRVLEMVEHGMAITPFIRYGDRIRIEMLNTNGSSVFGAIEQEVTPCQI
jgi:fumarylacetoacetate (FAA) hydrolase